MSELYELPKGWEWHNIDDLCEILDRLRKPISQKDRVSGDYPYYGATGIVDYIDNYIFDEKLLLVGEDGAKWGANEKTAFVADGKYWVNNHAHIMRPNRKVVLDEILVHYLNASDLSDYITGATVKKLNQEKLKSIPIPIPPLTEQQRIVEKLDLLFEKIDKAIALHQKNIDEADAFMGSALNEVLGELEEKYKSTNLLKLADLIDGDRGANYPKKSDFFEAEYCLFLSAKNVTKNGFVFSDNQFITKEKDQILRKGRLSRGDIIITTRGTIGNIAIYDDEVEYDAVRINSGMAIIRIKDKQCLYNRYLYKYLFSPQFSYFISTIQSGSAQPQINLTNLKESEFSIPPISIQQKVVAYLDDLSDKIERVRTVQKEKMDGLKALKASILDKAFRGEL